MATSNNKIVPIKDMNEISIAIPRSYRKSCGLDWAESYWIRWIYVVSWSWLNPILTLGSKRELTEDDLFDLSSNDECGQLLNKFETVWKQNENKYGYVDTWKIIIKTFWKEFLILGLIFLPYLATKIAQPLLLKQIVLSINDINSASHFGYLYAVGLALSIFFANNYSSPSIFSYRTHWNSGTHCSFVYYL